MKKRKLAFLVLFGFFAIGLLAWPFMSYLAIFAADDPNVNPIFVYYVILSIWAYPIFVFAGYKWGHYKRNNSLLSVILKTCVPLLSAMWYPIVAMLGYGISDALIVTEEEKLASELQDKYDPLYSNRLEMIIRRDPVADAQEAIRRDELALLPSGISPDDSWFRGLEKDEASRFDGSENYRKIMESDFLSELHQLVWDDKDEVDPCGVYFSPTYTKFYVASWQYKTAFNQVMKQKIEN